MGQDMYLMILFFYLFLFLSNLLLFSYFILSKTKTAGVLRDAYLGNNLVLMKEGIEELIMV
jgi:hypothetical protein